MHLKIRTQVNPDTGEHEVISFSCITSGTAITPYLPENEVLVHASAVPKRFYQHWFEYALEGTTLVWSDKMVARNAKESLEADSAKK